MTRTFNSFLFTEQTRHYDKFNIDVELYNSPTIVRNAAHTWRSLEKMKSFVYSNPSWANIENKELFLNIRRHKLRRIGQQITQFRYGKVD